ncbi:hypothetical protein L1987_20928 [Smallanthus sonchifolius]|uniref:Uncharacterized protein n=1 Tax=Smallanthus sonchifolius TaxID=185202 RepID=A0ACB9ISG0_9ASTR|nr:hypothetical protein L1987_20928 [Smallanthus sonchifolius]
MEIYWISKSISNTVLCFTPNHFSSLSLPKFILLSPQQTPIQKSNSIIGFKPNLLSPLSSRSRILGSQLRLHRINDGTSSTAAFREVFSSC